MSRAIPLESDLSPPRRGPWGVVIGAVLVLGIGIVFGTQYARPDPRVVAVVAALLVFGVAWRIDMVTGIGLLVVLLPFPRGTVFGNTNFALLLLLWVIWLLRITQHVSPPPRRTPLDVPMAGLLIAFVVSFYNLSKPEEIQIALQTMTLMVSGVLLIYLLASNVRTERQLKRLHLFMACSLLTIYLVGVFELLFPGRALVPGWIQYDYAVGAEITRGLRVSGPFHDFELYSEYSAVNFLFVLFLLVRSRSLLRRTFFAALLVLNLFIIMATVTRGGVISLFFGILYLLWLVRRRIQFVPLVIIGVAAIASFLAMNYYVAHYTISGNLLERVKGTHLVHGLPDDRVNTWQMAWERFLYHPIIGWGPIYVARIGTRLWFWPHNGYLLIANMVGSVGLSFFLWLLWKLWQITKPTVDSLTHPSYARAYLIVAHVQLAVFAIDQIKIDFLRNMNYLFQVWLLIAFLVAGARVARDVQTPRERAPA